MDFRISRIETVWDIAMTAENNMRHGHKNVRQISQTNREEGEALHKAIQAEGGAGPLTEIFREKIVWYSDNIPDAPDMARVHFIALGPYDTDIQFKRSFASILLLRDADVTPP